MPVYYNNDYSLLHMHVPKACGSYIKRIFLAADLYEVLESRDPKFLISSLQHIEADRLKSLVNLSKITYSFAVIRDPAQRILSEFYYRMKISDVNLDKRDHLFSEWLQQVISDYKHNNYCLDNHVRPQHHFLLKDINTFRIEDQYNQLKSWLLVKVGCKSNKCLIDNISPPTPHVSTNVLPKSLIHDFVSLYEDDYAILGYDIITSLKSAGFIT